MVMTAKEWNQLFEAERQSYNGVQPSCAPVTDTLYRFVNDNLQVSLEGSLRKITRKEYLDRKSGVDVSDQYSEEERLAFMAEAFPLNEEQLWTQ